MSVRDLFHKRARRQPDRLAKGKCSIKNVDDQRFIEIEQDGNRFHCLFGQSKNRKFIVAWEMSLNPLKDKNKHVKDIQPRFIMEEFWEIFWNAPD